MSNKVRVWDLPTRLFHWALVACIVASAVSGYRGGDAMVWHARIGYVGFQDHGSPVWYRKIRIKRLNRGR